MSGPYIFIGKNSFFLVKAKMVGQADIKNKNKKRKNSSKFIRTTIFHLLQLPTMAFHAVSIDIKHTQYFVKR